jgi:pimeloyl-ACP methyl ester carboxylesterase
MAVPIVLLHAFPLSSRMWQPLRAALPSRLELITPDFRGTPAVRLGEAQPSLDVLADDLARALDAANVGRAIISGLSMGGYVTMAFLRRHPDRAAAVVLADTRAGADADAARANRLRIAAALDTEGTTRVLVDDVLPTLLGSTTTTSRPDVVAFVKEIVESASPRGAAWWQRAMAARPDSFDTLRAVQVPALVIVGAEDALTPPSEAQALVDALPGARLVELPAAGHLSAVETPEPFAAALVEFAREVGVTSAG